MLQSRRSFLIGAGAAAIVAPAIVRASSLMSIKQMWGDGIALRCIPHPESFVFDTDLVQLDPINLVTEWYVKDQIYVWTTPKVSAGEISD